MCPPFKFPFGKKKRQATPSLVKGVASQSLSSHNMRSSETQPKWTSATPNGLPSQVATPGPVERGVTSQSSFSHAMRSSEIQGEQMPAILNGLPSQVDQTLADCPKWAPKRHISTMILTHIWGFASLSSEMCWALSFCHRCDSADNWLVWCRKVFSHQIYFQFYKTKIVFWICSPDDKRINFAFYDPEMHWCKHCELFPKTAKDYLTHLHSKEHQEKIKKHMDAPWHENNRNVVRKSYFWCV